MKIADYSFGTITVDGQDYESDVIIWPNSVEQCWQRKEGHHLRVEDLSRVLQKHPDVLIIGTGHDGVMRVPDSTQQAIRARGINLEVHATNKAVARYNQLQSSNRHVVAALHLTC